MKRWLRFHFQLAARIRRFVAYGSFRDRTSRTTDSFVSTAQRRKVVGAQRVLLTNCFHSRLAALPLQRKTGA